MCRKCWISFLTSSLIVYFHMIVLQLLSRRGALCSDGVFGRWFSDRCCDGDVYG